MAGRLTRDSLALDVGMLGKVSGKCEGTQT